MKRDPPKLGDPGSFAIRGRVVSVTCSLNGRFLVVVGPPPDMFAFEAESKPPKVGERIILRGRLVSSERIEASGLIGTLGRIEPTSYAVDPDEYPRRVVSDQWYERVLGSMARPLYRYQVDGAAWLASRIAAFEGALLCDDLGLGKTTQAIAALCATRSFPAVIVCPGSLKIQWAREFEHAVRTPLVGIIEGRYGPIAPAQVHILNYELLRYREEQLYLLRPRVIVFDEVQNLKTAKAGHLHRASVGTRLAERIKCVVGLTGTPLINHPKEMWRQLHLVDRHGWPSFKEFSRAYCGARKADDDDTIETPIGRVVETSAGRVQRIDELQAKAGPYMLRRLKHQVLSDLPPKSRHSLLVHVDEQHLRHYRAAEKDVVSWLRRCGYVERAASAERAHAIVKLNYLRRLVALAKLRQVIPEYLTRWFDRPEREPLVIFAYHVDVMRGVLEICRRIGLRVVGIAGGEKAEKKQAAVDAFMNGLADVFCAPIMAGGVGLNLQRASDALFCERVYAPSQLVQAEDRIHRIGSTRPVTITYLDAAKTVDEHLAHIVSAKQALIRATLDEESDKVSEAVETVDELAGMLLRRAAG